MEGQKQGAFPFWDAFEGGLRRERELRLAPEELAALCRECPEVVCTPMGEPSGGKTWYHIILEGTC